MDCSSYSHIGWVPCVAGRLYFRHANCGMGNAPISRINVVERSAGEADDPLTRHVLVASTVNWRDQRRDANGRKTAGLYRVILQGVATEGATVLDGSVHIVPAAEARHSHRDIERDLRALRIGIERREAVAEHMVDVRDALRELTPAHEHAPAEDRALPAAPQRAGSAAARIRPALRQRDGAGGGPCGVLLHQEQLACSQASPS